MNSYNDKTHRLFRICCPKTKTSQIPSQPFYSCSYCLIKSTHNDTSFTRDYFCHLLLPLFLLLLSSTSTWKIGCKIGWSMFTYLDPIFCSVINVYISTGMLLPITNSPLMFLTLLLLISYSSQAIINIKIFLQVNTEYFAFFPRI